MALALPLLYIPGNQTRSIPIKRRNPPRLPSSLLASIVAAS
ncbi:BnaC02g29780D [Brassica napus]|uniref:BnaC02g29780D protein n=2 Tax=Brassica TaxID=3705 RepID=A0A078FIF8_BRANA|nr:BnaC02g29780D [Brassica napus]VDD40529.1 unnamed protein product [Brassica oleracea]